MKIKKILRLALLAGLLIPLGTSLAEETYMDTGSLLSNNETIGITQPMPSAEEVRNYWRSYETSASEKIDFCGAKFTKPGGGFNNRSIYLSSPNPQKGERGLLRSNAIEDTLHLINTYRYMTGLSPVAEVPDLSKKAQAASAISYLNGTISHQASVPAGLDPNSEFIKDGLKGCAESNLGAGYVTPYGIIEGCMNDEDYSNMYDLGHRRWLLLPNLKNVGIGYVEGFAATYVFDGGYVEHKNVVVYPAANTILELIDKQAPFSVIVGNSLEVSDDASVTVQDLKSGFKKTYSLNNGLTISRKGYGYSQALIFGADLKKNLLVNYKISVDGVYDNGLAYPIEYSVKFILGGDPVDYKLLDKAIAIGEKLDKKKYSKSKYNGLMDDLKTLKMMRKEDTSDQEAIDFAAQQFIDSCEFWVEDPKFSEEHFRFVATVAALRQAFEENKNMVYYAEEYMQNNYMAPDKKAKLSKIIENQKALLDEFEEIIISFEKKI